MFCLSARNNKKENQGGKQPPMPKGSVSSQHHLQNNQPQSSLETKSPHADPFNATSFYNILDGSIEPIKVDIIGVMRPDSQKKSVENSSPNKNEAIKFVNEAPNRFVALTATQLIVFDEVKREFGPNCIYKPLKQEIQIKNIDLKDAAQNLLALQISEFGTDTNVTLVFRSEVQKRQWQGAISKMNSKMNMSGSPSGKNLTVTGQDTVSVSKQGRTGEEYFDDEVGEESQASATRANIGRSKNHSANEPELREHRLKLQAVLKQRIEQGDAQIATQICDMTEQYLNQANSDKDQLKVETNRFDLQAQLAHSGEDSPEPLNPDEEYKENKIQILSADEQNSVSGEVQIVDFGSRDQLPYLKDPANKPSVWQILKDSIGKDLTKFCVPVYFNEPMSMVQRVSECMEYQYLLNEADMEQDPVKRMAKVAAFAVAQYKSTNKRLGKPFNPLLGETYELVGDGWKYFSEQVSHHPPISACIGESDRYQYHMDTYTKMSLSMKGSFDAYPIGFQHIILKSHDEHYSVSRPASCVHNLMFGTMYLEHVGQMNIHCHTSDLYAALEFKQQSWTGQNAHVVTGHIYPNAKTKDPSQSLGQVIGKWSTNMSIKMPNGESDLLWQCTPDMAQTDWQYMFTQFSLKINCMTDEYKQVLPRSDSRLRPDLRALENGEFDLAATEKHRLEEKQRATRKWRAENPGNDFQPKYFRQIMDPNTNELYYAYGAEGCRDYWEDRKNQDFAHMEDIY